MVAYEISDATEVLGANTIAEMMELESALRLQAARALMAQGVTIHRPETCVIDADVTVGPDTIVEPFVQLLGKTHIGEDCRIRSYSVIQDSKIGDGVLVRNGCVLDEARLAAAPYRPLCPSASRQPDRTRGPCRQLCRNQKCAAWEKNRRRII